MNYGFFTNLLHTIKENEIHNSEKTSICLIPSNGLLMLPCFASMYYLSPAFRMCSSCFFPMFFSPGFQMCSCNFFRCSTTCLRRFACDVASSFQHRNLCDVVEIERSNIILVNICRPAEAWADQPKIHNQLNIWLDWDELNDFGKVELKRCDHRIQNPVSKPLSIVDNIRHGLECPDRRI